MIDIAPAYHGAFDYAELEAMGLHPDEVLDFSVNSNPYGPAPAIAEALATVPLDRYPDRESLALRRVLSEQLDVPMDNLVMGNGTAELLWLTAFAHLQAGARVLIIGPTFGEYARVAAMMGAEVCEWQAEPDNFAINTDGVGQALSSIDPQMVFLCNPNNPTGQILPPPQIGLWAKRHPETLFVVDEAYLNFTPTLKTTLTLKLPNLLILRSMTKDYALAGLRLGYVVSHNLTLIETIARVRPPWNVNGLAQVAGLVALQEAQYYQTCLAELRQETERFRAELSGLGWIPLPSQTHYFLVEVESASEFRDRLLKQGILVRDCRSFGLPHYVRIATRRSAENARLVGVLR